MSTYYRTYGNLQTTILRVASCVRMVDRGSQPDELQAGHVRVRPRTRWPTAEAREWKDMISVTRRAAERFG